MTDEMMNLRALAEKAQTPICCFAVQMEVAELTGAYGEKSAERLAQRYGYRDRTWETRAVELRIPKRFLEPRRMGEKR